MLSRRRPAPADLAAASDAAVLASLAEDRAGRRGALARLDAEPPVPVPDGQRFADRTWTDNPAFFASGRATWPPAG